MGTCASDIYKTAKRQYGDAFEKFIIQEQSLAKIREFLKEKEEQFNEKLSLRKDNLHKEVNQRQQQLNTNFSKTQLNLQSQLPYGVASFEQMRKTSLENLLGLDGFQRKFQNSHKLIDAEISQAKSDLHKKSEEIIVRFERQNKFDEQRLKTFKDLPEKKRKLIHEKGTKEFQSQIHAKIKELQDLINKELNFESFQKKLNDAIPLKELDNSVNQSRVRFQTEVANIVGAHSDSNINV